MCFRFELKNQSKNAVSTEFLQTFDAGPKNSSETTYIAMKVIIKSHLDIISNCEKLNKSSFPKHLDW